MILLNVLKSLVALLLCVVSGTFSFVFTSKATQRNRRIAAHIVASGSPRPIHTCFTVEKATPEKMKELGVTSWPNWSTAGSGKYKVGVKSPLKVYDTNELSYIISGEMDIIPQETGVPVRVSAGDFVTFPDGFECYWFVKETVNKHWFLY